MKFIQNQAVFHLVGAVRFGQTQNRTRLPCLMLRDKKFPGKVTLLVVRNGRLNAFTDDWTLRLSDNKRAFLIGNALVVNVIARIAVVLRSEWG